MTLQRTIPGPTYRRPLNQTKNGPLTKRGDLNATLMCR
jgi:hypothetical protein